MRKRPIYEHRIPFELSGLATLLVDYLSRWGEEMELLSVLLATLIIGLLLDAQGILDNTIVGVIFAIIVVAEFVFTLAIAYRRRELEYELWRAVHELKAGATDDSTSTDGR